MSNKRLKREFGGRIKVLRIIARLNIGGPALHTILLTAGLDKTRFESLLVGGKPEKSEGDMAYLAKEKAVAPIIIPELGRSLNMRKDVVAFWKLFRLIKRERPEIIHTHTAKAGTLGRLAALFCILNYRLSTINYRPKLIHTFHGHVLHSYFGRFKSLLFIFIERCLAKFTDKIIAVSESVRRDLLRLKIASAKKIIIIPLGLELEQFLKINNPPLLKDYRTIGIVGRLVPVKNHQMFLKAARRLKDGLGAENKLKFLIIGDGPLRQGLQVYARRLGIAENVNFTGWVRNLESLYADLDIVALTSLNEGTPVALIEALASGRPCVATRVGGVGDVVEEGRSGFLVSSGDVPALVQSLLKLLSSSQLRREMGRYGRERVKERFSKNRLIKDMEALYLQEIKGDKGR